MGEKGYSDSLWTCVLARDQVRSDRLSAYEAFSQWYGKVLVLHEVGAEVGHPHRQHMHRVTYRYQHNPGLRTFIENYTFPCNNCCLCSGIQSGAQQR